MSDLKYEFFWLSHTFYFKRHRSFPCSQNFCFLYFLQDVRSHVSVSHQTEFLPFFFFTLPNGLATNASLSLEKEKGKAGAREGNSSTILLPLLGVATIPEAWVGRGNGEMQIRKCVPAPGSCYCIYRSIRVTICSECDLVSWKISGGMIGFSKKQWRMMQIRLQNWF